MLFTCVPHYFQLDVWTSFLSQFTCNCRYYTLFTCVPPYIYWCNHFYIYPSISVCLLSQNPSFTLSWTKLRTGPGPGGGTAPPGSWPRLWPCKLFMISVLTFWTLVYVLERFGGGGQAQGAPQRLAPGIRVGLKEIHYLLTQCKKQAGQ